MLYLSVQLPKVLPLCQAVCQIRWRKINGFLFFLQIDSFLFLNRSTKVQLIKQNKDLPNSPSNFCLHRLHFLRSIICLPREKLKKKVLLSARSVPRKQTKIIAACAYTAGLIYYSTQHTTHCTKVDLALKVGRGLGCVLPLTSPNTQIKTK